MISRQSRAKYCASVGAYPGEPCDPNAYHCLGSTLCLPSKTRKHNGRNRRPNGRSFRRPIKHPFRPQRFPGGRGNNEFAREKRRPRSQGRRLGGSQFRRKREAQAKGILYQPSISVINVSMYN